MPGLTPSRSLPESLPSFMSHTGHIAQPASKPVFRNLSFVNQEIDPQAFSALSIEPSVQPKPLPPFYETNTSFSCHRPADHIFRSIGSALAPYSVTAKPEKGKYKGNAVVLGQCIAFQVHLFKKPEPEGGHLIEFQRRRGCSCAFYHFFHSTMSQLSNELADAAAFLKDSPFTERVSKKRLESAPSFSTSKVSEKTLKILGGMATTNSGSQLDALQTLNYVVDSKPKDFMGEIGKIALTAYSSEDSQVRTMGKSIMTKLMGQNDHAEAAPSSDRGDANDKLRDQVMNVMDVFAKSTLESMKTESFAEVSDFTKGEGKVPDLGSRETAEA
eukprot:CAMPEP_0170189140 /NCGR_PEP_ID=MMETSP0040_2-20121228/46076_1 /TAXON_ID=641309 /ORGANISM="Lotharella oceanica, Strain CCMP622" /LENGTH=328 /DNA_ID=CAMNT_0010436621 /DNA_START=114 /DNA_END=1100 /DNA_ORIENTATION=-